MKFESHPGKYNEYPKSPELYDGPYPEYDDDYDPDDYLNGYDE